MHKKGKVKKGLGANACLITHQRDNAQNLDVIAIAYDLLAIDKLNMTEEEKERMEEIIQNIRKVQKTSPKITEQLDKFIYFLEGEILKDSRVNKKKNWRDTMKENEWINCSFVKKKLADFSKL
jgi:hypothetical protein